MVEKLKDIHLQRNKMSEINLIEEDLWDHYSGLPNPAWYQYHAH